MTGAPTPADLADPLFASVYAAIEAWEIRRPDETAYTGATGADAMVIVRAIRAAEGCPAEDQKWAHTELRGPATTLTDPDDMALAVRMGMVREEIGREDAEPYEIGDVAREYSRGRRD